MEFVCSFVTFIYIFKDIYRKNNDFYNTHANIFHFLEGLDEKIKEFEDFEKDLIKSLKLKKIKQYRFDKFLLKFPYLTNGFEAFPSWLPDFVRNGKRIFHENSIGYYLEGINRSRLKLEGNAIDANDDIQECFYTYVQQQLKGVVRSSWVYVTDCVSETLNHASPVIYKKMPLERENYELALVFLEEEFLIKNKNESLFNVSEYHLTKILKKTHELLNKGIVDSTNIYYQAPGNFRLSLQMVQPTEGTELNCIRLLQGKTKSLDLASILVKTIGLSRAEAENINSMLDRLFNNKPLSLDQYLSVKNFLDDNFTKEEQLLLRKGKIFILPLPQNIPHLVSKFINDFKEKGKLVDSGKLHPISFAAWTHQAILKIHPFKGANGRLARAWMNSILMRFDCLPVIFKSDESYVNAIQADLEYNETGAFEEFLKESMIWTSHQLKNLNR